MTLVCAEIDGAPELLDVLGERYAAVAERCHALLRAALAPRGGHAWSVGGEGIVAVHVLRARRPRLRD